MRKALVALFVALVCVAHVAMAADDGQTQPKYNTATNNSHITATDVIATTNGAGNVKGVFCSSAPDGSGNLSIPVVKFYVNGGSAQSVTLTNGFLSTDPGFLVQYTGWVPYNVRFTSSIRVTIQKLASTGATMDCAVSWALD